MNAIVRYSTGVTMSYSVNAFMPIEGYRLPPYMRLPGARAGALSCLTGIAARKSMDGGQPVRIADLLWS